MFDIMQPNRYQVLAWTEVNIDSNRPALIRHSNQRVSEIVEP